MNLSSRLRDARPAPVKRGRWLTGSALGLTIAAWTVAGSAALAQVQLPGTVNSTVGGVSFGANNGTSQTITQTTQRAIINWNDFNIANGQTLTFDQQLGTSSIILNRVTGGTATSINGMLNANGQVWVLNPNGMLVGSSGRISARGFLGSTAGITDADFTDGNFGGDNIFNFTGSSSSSVTNYGQITVTNGGYAVLAGQHVDNNSLIRANLGRVVLAGVPTFTLDVTGDSLLSFAIDEGATFQTAASVSNGGTITAQGGKVLMTARAAAGLTGSVVNLQGLIEAQTATVDGNGQVVLSGTGGTAGEVVIDGGANTTVINGFVDQNGARAGGVINVNSQMDTDAGSITVLGNSIDIGLTQQAKLLATGLPGADGITRANGGTISIGTTMSAGIGAATARSIRIGYGPGFDANDLPGVELQAASFGGTGTLGGEITLATTSAADASVTIGGYLNVESDRFLAGPSDQVGTGGANGIAGTINVSSQTVTLQSTATIDAGAFASGGTGGTVNIAGTDIAIDGQGATAAAITAVGAKQGGTIRIGGDVEGVPILGRDTLARSVRIGSETSVAGIFASGYTATGTGGGTISVWSDPDDALAGTTSINGALSVRSVAANGTGGAIVIGGRDVTLLNSTTLNATGTAATGTGGTINVKGASVDIRGALNGSQPFIDTSGALGAGSIAINGLNNTNVGGGAKLLAVSNAGTGGAITITGDMISIGDAATETRIAASGVTAGSVAIGGDIGGSPIGDSGLATTVLINPLARIEADGFGTAEGGQISVWSDRNNSSASTTVLGKLYARSGLQDGDGGVIEIGGHYVRVEDNARLDTTASRFGGNVRLLGTRIDLDTNPSTEQNPVGIFAWGLQGGGEINIGGGPEGGTISAPLPTFINIGPTSRLNANAINTGPGGTITVIADQFNSSSILLLGGSMAVDSPDGAAGVIEVRGADIRFGTLSASAMGNEGWIGIYESGYGYGYGTAGFAEGGPVGLSVGDGGFVGLNGEFATNGGSLTLNAGNVGRVDLAGFLETQGGNVAVNAGNDSYVEISGTVDASSGATSGGSIDVALGARGNFYSDGTIATAGNRVALSGGNDAYIQNDGLIASNGGSVSLTVGSTTGLGEYSAGIENYGDITTGGGSLTVVIGDLGSVYSGFGASFASGGGDVAFTVGNDSDIELDGTILTGGGRLSISAGDFAAIDNYGDILTDGGSVSFVVGSGSIEAERPAYLANYGLIDTTGRQGVGGNIQLTAGTGSFIDLDGEFVTAGGSFGLTAGEASRADIDGNILTAGGNLSISLGTGGSIGLFSNSFCEGECYSYGRLDAGSGNVELTASDIYISSDFAGPPSIFGNNVRLNADTVDIYGAIAATSSIGIASITADRDLTIGGYGHISSASITDGYGYTSLELTDEELDNLDAPTVILGRADGTGSVSIFLSPDGDSLPDQSIEPPSTTIVQAGGTGGTITVYGQGSTDTGETVRLIAGSSITLAADAQIEVNGKLELVSGGSFVNNAGAGALTTPAGGQWLIYSADPSVDSFGGLLSGQTAIWGRGFADVAANGITHSGNRYAFALAPTLTVTVAGKTKTYGDALALTSPVLGSDYSISGLVDAAAFGNVFVQDSLSGAVALSSAGAAATADAGSYTIDASAGGLAAPAGYSLSFVSGGLTVNRRLLTASLVDVSKVYDGTTAAALGAANYSLAGFVNGDAGSVTITNTSGVYDNRNVGSGKTVTVNGVTLTGAKAGNYEIGGTLTGAVGTITPATLTYVANPVTRRRGLDNPSFAGSITGFVGGDTQATATSGTLTFTSAATIESPVGSYAIDGSGLTAGNYVFVQAPGNATALTVTDGGAVQQVTTSVIQQVTNAARVTPTLPPPPPIQPPANLTTGLPTGTNLTGAPPAPPPPPPPPPPPGRPAGSPPSGPGVESTPPSPVGDTPPETPSDAADQGDPVLAEAKTEDEQDQAPSEKRQLANTTNVVPGVDMEVPAPPRSTDVPGAEQSFSGSGNPAQW